MCGSKEPLVRRDNGDVELEQLLPRLRAFLLQRLLPDESLDDTVQECLIAIVRAAPRFRNDSSFVTFALAVAWRTTLARRRSLNRYKLAMQNASTRSEVDGDDSGVATTAYDAWVARHRCSAMQRLLAALPQAQRETLLMHYAESFSIVEIAHATNVPIETVRSRLRAGRKRLRQIVQSDPAFQELFVMRPDDAHAPFSVVVTTNQRSSTS